MSIKTDVKVAKLEQQVAELERDLADLRAAVAALTQKGTKRGQSKAQ